MAPSYILAVIGFFTALVLFLKWAGQLPENKHLIC